MDQRTEFLTRLKKELVSVENKEKYLIENYERWYNTLTKTELNFIYSVQKKIIRSFESLDIVLDDLLHDCLWKTEADVNEGCYPLEDYYLEFPDLETTADKMWNILKQNRHINLKEDEIVDFIRNKIRKESDYLRS